MRYIFFIYKEYPGFRGTITEKDLVKCGAGIYIAGRGVDLVVVRVDNDRVRHCVERSLEEAGIEYFEMEGTPRTLKYKRSGITRAEVEFV
jgi:hypothetical protein